MSSQTKTLQDFATELQGYLVIGHSGHRNIFPEQKDPIFCALKEKINEIKNKSTQPCVLISGLAAGADELAVRAAIDCGIMVSVLLADKQETDRLKSFNNKNQIIRSAFQVTGTDDDLYVNQAELILLYSNQILLLWDGVDSGKGGGPSYIYQKSIDKKAHQNTLCLHQLVTPRETNPFPVLAKRLGKKRLFIDNPELKWYDNDCPIVIKESWSERINILGFLNRHESLILQFVLPAFLLLLTIFLGMKGFYDYHICLHQSPASSPLLNQTDYFFKALNLATLNSSVLGEGSNCEPFILDAARFSGLVFFAYAVLLTLIKLTGSNLNRFWIHSWRIWFKIGKLFKFLKNFSRKGPYDTIIGMSEAAHYLALDLLKSGHKVVVVDSDGESVYKTTCQAAGALIYSNKPNLKVVLEKIKIELSDSIYIFSEDDSINARFMQHVDRHLTKVDKKHKPKLFVHVKDVRERYFLDNTTLIQKETFQINENISRKLLREFPLDRTQYSFYSRTGVELKKVQVIIMGFSDIGKTICLHVAGNGHYQNNISLAIKIYYEPAERENVTNFKAQYPCFYENSKGFERDNCARQIQHEVFLTHGSAALIEFEELPSAESIILHDSFSLYGHIVKENIVNIYCCSENALFSASLANDILPYLNFLKIKNSCNLQVLCYCNLPDLQEIAIIEEKLNKAASDVPIQCFGNFLEACSFSAIHQNHLDDFSKKLGLWYHYVHGLKMEVADAKLLWLQNEIAELDKTALFYWDKQSESIRDANRAAADHIFIKLRHAGVSSNDGATYAATKLEEHKVELAKIEHTRWCAQKLIEGFSPLIDTSEGANAESKWIEDKETKNMLQSLKLHLNLKPFDQLSTSEKKKDFSQIEGIPYIINLGR